MNKITHYCRLCVNTINDNFLTLEENPNFNKVIQILFLGMDMKLVSQPKICQNCVKSVQFSYYFKQSIMGNELRLRSLQIQKDIPTMACRLCLTENLRDDVIFLYENSFYCYSLIRTMIEISVIEMNFDLFTKPVICNHCWTVVKQIYIFKKNCFETEEKLKIYAIKQNLRTLTDKDIQKLIFEISISHNIIRQENYSNYIQKENVEENPSKETAGVLEISEEKNQVFENRDNIMKKNLSKETALREPEEISIVTEESKVLENRGNNYYTKKEIVEEPILTETKKKSEVIHATKVPKTTSNNDIKKEILDENFLLEQEEILIVPKHIKEERSFEETTLNKTEEEYSENNEESNVSEETIIVKNDIHYEDVKFQNSLQKNIECESSDLFNNNNFLLNVPAEELLNNLETVTQNKVYETSFKEENCDQNNAALSKNYTNFPNKICEISAINKCLTENKEHKILSTTTDKLNEENLNINEDQTFEQNKNICDNANLTKSSETHIITKESFKVSQESFSVHDSNEDDSFDENEEIFHCTKRPKIKIDQDIIPKTEKEENYDEEDDIFIEDVFLDTNDNVNESIQYQDTEAKKLDEDKLLEKSNLALIISPKTQKINPLDQTVSKLFERIYSKDNDLKINCDTKVPSIYNKENNQNNNIIEVKDEDLDIKKENEDTTDLENKEFFSEDNIKLELNEELMIKEEPNYTTDDSGSDSFNAPLKHKNKTTVLNLKCHQCNYTFDFKKQLTGHIKKFYLKDDQEGYSCNDCTYETVHKRHLIRHINTVHKHIFPKINSKTFKCFHCSFETRHKSRLTDHSLSHQPIERIEKLYRCSKCDKKFKRKTHLDCHYLVHEFKETFDCFHCNYKAKRKTHLKTHMLKHLQPGTIKFNCTKCSYWSNRQCHLNVHVRFVHEGVPRK